MQSLKYALANLIGTLLRFVPLPVKTGVRTIGNPGPEAPVLATGNFFLTVERVKWALRGQDVFLLVCNSRGINIWCAAAGGLLTNHDVVSALKTSGIEQKVSHRRLLLPQLAAVGIEARVIREKTGWDTVWGPVYTADIPEFINRGAKTAGMRTVKFPALQRVEMAAAWAFPMSILTGLAALAFWRAAFVRVVVLVWGMSLVLYLCFPFYSGLLERGRDRMLNFEHAGLPLVLAGASLVALYLWSPVEFFPVRWGVTALVLSVILTLDLSGSTPVYKSSLQKDRLYAIALDIDACTGVGYCEEVCPRNCFEVNGGKADIPRRELCVRCGACVVQCPLDALYFRASGGKTVLPETIRKFKLNLMGERGTRKNT